MEPRIEYIEGEKIFFYEEVESTMDIARRLAKADERGIVIAEKQTAGRARRGVEWVSNTGGLYLTWIFDYKPEEKETGYAMEGLALAVVDTLRHFGVTNCRIKEPNDIYVDGKKISGILLYHLSYGLLVGVGVNLNNDLGNVKDIAISVKDIKLTEVDIASFLAEFIKSVKVIRNRFPRDLSYLIRRWRKLLTK